MKLAVAGGTGVVGRFVVEQGRAAGHEIVALSRSAGVDLTRATGLADALAGADTVIDVSNVSTVAKKKAVAFYETVTANLLSAEHTAGVRHHVALSIVGVDRVPFGYYQGKLAQERVIAAGDVPWTVLRATQFHEFAGQLLDRIKGPLVPIPKMRSATVAAQEVAARLVELAVAEPAGLAAELAGPDVLDMPDLARRMLGARGSHRFVLPVRQPGATGRLMAGDGLLPAGDCIRGEQTFDAWLAGQSRSS